jgi:hypothetical protein
MIKEPASTDGGGGWIVIRSLNLFLLVSPSPTLSIPTPPRLTGVAGADGATCDGVALFMSMSSATIGENVGENVGGSTITGALRVVLFLRFEFFFLASTPICIVSSKNTTEIASIDIRTGLHIFDSPFATTNFPNLYLNPCGSDGTVSSVFESIKLNQKYFE